jgi:hypothetical protein
MTSYAIADTLLTASVVGILASFSASKRFAEAFSGLNDAEVIVIDCYVTVLDTIPL